MHKHGTVAWRHTVIFVQSCFVRIELAVQKELWRQKCQAMSIGLGEMMKTKKKKEREKGISEKSALFIAIIVLVGAVRVHTLGFLFFPMFLLLLLLEMTKKKLFASVDGCLLESHYNR